MRIVVTLLTVGLVGAVAVAGERDAIGRMFAKRCALCHTIPDSAIRTDLAWLDQVKRTS